MRIIECYVEGFGKLTNKKYEFTSGFNCINEDNGSGKTTLATFIKVMLYGIGDTKKTSLEENDRKHYLPWGSGKGGGSLTFAVGEKTYRVERSFSTKAAEDTFALYDLTLGKASDDYSERLGEEIFGIDADGFERTVFLSERALSPKSDNKSISAKLSDLVGCDGDIGDMDEALKALESQRKFYHKKGGSGELTDTKNKIGEIKARLEALDELERALGEAQKKLGAANAAAEAVRNEMRGLVKEHEAAAMNVAKADFDIHYRDMKAALDTSAKRRDELLELLGGNPPSFNQIDEESYKYNEAKSVILGQNDSAHSKEYQELNDYFGGRVSEAEIAGAKAALGKLKAREEVKKSAEYVELAALFAKRIPESDELEHVKEMNKGGASGKFVLLPALASLVACVGIVLGIFVHWSLFLLILASAAMMCIGVALSTAASRNVKEKVSDFLRSVTDLADGDEFDAEELLEKMSLLRDRAEALIMDSEAKESERLIAALLAIFPEAEGAEEIVEKYEKYSTLAAAEQYMMTDKSARLERAKRLMRESLSFVAEYKVSDKDPFGELRSMLTEYNMLNSRIAEKRAEMERFATLHTFGEDEEKKATMSLEEVGAKRRVLEECAAELAREIGLLERSCKSYSDELDMRDELLMTKAELEEKLEKYLENYNVILLTKKYLTAAKDNMTVRYIGKTKESFERYSALISGSEGDEFMMSTDFGISKTDGGATRSIDAYSRGTRDLYNVAARLSLADSLYEGEKPFIILDDPFCSFDDKKVGAALEILKQAAKERQIIYFTCSSSRS